jgi:hypothetical protein
VAQVIEYLPSKCKSLMSNLSATKKKRSKLNIHILSLFLAQRTDLGFEDIRLLIQPCLEVARGVGRITDNFLYFPYLWQLVRVL